MGVAVIDELTKRDATQSSSPVPAPGSLVSGRDCGSARRHGKHDPETERDDRGYREPHARYLPQDAGLPQRQASAEQQDEIADEVDLQESHDRIGCRKGARSVRGS